jgi:hypothetical protein
MKKDNNAQMQKVFKNRQEREIDDEITSAIKPLPDLEKDVEAEEIEKDCLLDPFRDTDTI